MMERLYLFCCFLGFKVETDVGINASSVPVWIKCLSCLKVQIWNSSDSLFFSKALRGQRELGKREKYSSQVSLDRF